ncbi:hypothetical protein BGW38_005326 [Lunasporangiospora selenospora]|uniref:Major facilitator superfamily (MFS) profile domain-containing protein n=1 Tax=Lunasporangiospora selenospora TaxID=979761 RepID=A0A9P6KHC0_9FUNG|nr:hypothetical protein BGW38_005326 [Lunasporangiospora selenospora]
MIPERQDSDIDQCPPPFETQHQDCGSNKSLVSSSEDISGSVMQGTNGLNSNSEIEAVSQVNPDRGDPNSLEAGTPGRLSNSNSDATVENVENGGSIDKSREQAAAKRPSFFQSIRIFKDPQFLSLTLAELAASIGYLIPLYYMQTYAIFIGLTPEKGALILGISNGAAFVGRIVLGLIADRVSNTRTLMFCVWMTAFSVTVLWSIAKSFGTLLLMGITFNMFAGAYVSLVPVAVAESFGTKEIASMIGLMYAAGGIAIWVGSPLAGFILDSTLPNLSYTPVIITAGISMISGAIFVTSWAYFHRRAERIEEVATRVNTSCSP